MRLDGRSGILVASFERETSRRGENPACYRPLVAFLTMARYLGVEASLPSTKIRSSPYSLCKAPQGSKFEVLGRG